ncbi:uncharacterized protein PHA67_003837 isoform 1-T1 [Liasis olivaceus]
MAVVLWTVFLLLLDHSFQEGNLLLPPWNVMLISENFYPRLIWQPTPNITDSIRYEVERSNSNRSSPTWIKEVSCKGNNQRETQSCQLHLPQLFSTYHARVRARDGSILSEWAKSNGLQLYKDTIIGPLVLSLTITEHTLSVSISLPPTPLKEKDSSVILSLLKVLLTLQGEDGSTQKVMMANELGTDLWNMNLEYTMSLEHIFHNMKPNANYCVEAEVVNHPAKKAVECMLMPGSPTSNYWTVFVISFVTLFGVILLSVVGRTFLKPYLHLSSKGLDFPKSLIFLHETCVSRCVFHLEAGPSISLLVVAWPNNHSFPTEQEKCQIEFIPGGCYAQSSSPYCINGFFQGNPSNKDAFLSSLFLVETSSVIGLVRDKDPTDKCCRIVPQHLESSHIPSPLSARFHFDSLGTGHWKLKCKVDLKDGLAEWPSASSSDILLSSLILQSTPDIQSLPYNPRACVTVENYHTYPEIATEDDKKLFVCEEHSRFSNNREHPKGPNLEVKRSEMITFPGYDFRPPILSCDL